MTTISRRSFNLALGSLCGAGLTGIGAGSRSGQLAFASGHHRHAVHRRRRRRWPGPRARGGAVREARRAFHRRKSPGAGGNIGAAAVAKPSPMATRCCLRPTVRAPSTSSSTRTCSTTPSATLPRSRLLSEIPAIIAAGPQSPVKTFTELVSYAKANPEKLTFGTPGNGTLGHIIAVLVQKQTGIKLNHVPYRGSAPLTSDLMGGQVALGLRFHGDVCAAYQRRPLARHRAAEQGAQRSDPQCPDGQGSRRHRHRRQRLVRAACPRTHAGGDHRQDQQATNAFIKSDKGTGAAQSPVDDRGRRHASGAQDFIAAEIAKWRPVVKEANIAI